jgi:hypothetical protein
VKYELSISDDLFQEKILRDLQSIILDPMILKDAGAAHLQLQLKESVTRFIAKDPERLLRMVPRPEVRLPLGKWFERVFLAALRIGFPFARTFHSVSDNRGGELDFILMDGSKTIHIECSVKFFLHHPDRGSDLNSFVGPGGQDRLDLKFAKMRDVQLQRKIPENFVAGQDVARILWMSGRIHNPIVEYGSTAQSNTNGFSWAMNRHHLLGFWGHIHEVFNALDSGDVLIRLPRQWWMTTLDGFSRGVLEIFDVVTRSEIITEPFMVARIAFIGGIAKEIGRGFIVAPRAEHHLAAIGNDSVQK